MNRTFAPATTPRQCSAPADRIVPVALTLVACVWLALANAAADPTPAPANNRVPVGPASYESFRLIHTRNVFDPDRRPIRPNGGPPLSSAPTQADYAALTGTMISAEKTYAFFSGSRPEFDKVLSVNDKFANATITGITAQSIEVERDGKRTTVLVGQTVPFDNQTAPGEPPVVDTAAVTSFSAPAPTGSPAYRPPGAGNYGGGNYGAGGGNYGYRANAAPTPVATPRAAPANIEEIRRRMMEKRQQDLK